jgi:arginine:agmatine antiporter
MAGNRKLGPVLATVVVAGNMIGSGVFLLPATLASVGSLTMLGWVIGAVGAMALALLFGKMAQRKPLAGGPATYAYDAFGRFAGSQVSLWYWTCCLIGNVAIALAASSYLISFMGFDASPAMGALVTAALLWLVTLVNLVSPRFVGQVDGPLLVIGVIPLLLAITIGWTAFDAMQFRESWNVSGEPLYYALPHSLALVFWAFTGLESASVASAVVDNPERNVRIATIAGVSIAAVIYIAASIVIFGIAPADEIAASNAPFALAAAKALGPFAGSVVALCAALKALGTLTGWVLMTAQVSHAAAARGLLPPVFARTRAGDTPVAGLIIAGVLGTLAVMLTMAPTLGRQFGLLAEASTVFALMTYLAACAAAVKFRVRGEMALAVTGGLFCVFVIAWSTRPVLIASGICLVILLALYWPLTVKPRAASRATPDDPR